MARSSPQFKPKCSTISQDHQPKDSETFVLVSFWPDLRGWERKWLRDGGRLWAQSWERGWSEELRARDERLEWPADRWSEGWLAAVRGREIREVERREKRRLWIRGTEVKKKKKKVLAGITISPGIGRNAWNDSKHPEIWLEVEWGVTSYQFAYRYEIFRSFQPERNRIYNFVS